MHYTNLSLDPIGAMCVAGSITGTFLGMQACNLVRRIIYRKQHGAKTEACAIRRPYLPQTHFYF